MAYGPETYFRVSYEEKAEFEKQPGKQHLNFFIHRE
jgi:hypothetical protein